MIQSSKMPEPKATESVKAPVRGHEPKRSEKVTAESRNEFKKELNKELEGEQSSSEPQVKKVEVSSDKALRAPSSLIQSSDGQPETVAPKVFDPALTEGVQNLIDPKTVQLDADGAAIDEMVKKLDGKVGVSELQAQEAEIDPEISETLLKLPQVKQSAANRSPAIDFAKSEVDPQLMSMEDFVAQKNAAIKKAVPQGAYGMKPATNQAAQENGLKSTEVVTDISMLENAAGTGSPVNSQQFILNNLAEQGSPKVAEASAAAKTFDMSQVKSADANQVMNQISDYIVQAKAAKEPMVNLRVNHQDLGMIDITVMKSGAVNSDAIAINIGAHSAEGKQFFQQNTKELFAHLSSAGISVADMKIDSASNTGKSDFDFNQQNQKHASSGERQFGSEQNERRHEQNRREELWKLFNKEAA